MRYLLVVITVLSVVTLVLVVDLTRRFNRLELSAGPLSSEVSNREFLGYDINDLTKSCAVGDLQLVQKMLRSGVNLHHKDSKGWFPLCKASAHGHLEVVQYLLKEGANINELTTNKNNPLIFAITYKHPEVVEYLLVNGSDPFLERVDDSDSFELADIYGDDQIRSLLQDFRNK